MQGIKISVGFAEFRDALMAIILTGMRVKPEACKQRNIICALDAVSLLGFSSWRLSMAFKPNGVAALSSPNRLAEKFITIWPVAGWPFGTSGNSLAKKGPIIFDNSLMPPALSAMLIKPMNSAMMPINFKQMFTAVQQVSIIPSTPKGFPGSLAFPMTIQLKISDCPRKKHLKQATTIATIMKADHILLNAIVFCCYRGANL